MSDGPVFVERIDYEAAAEAMYDADDAYRDSWDSQPDDGVKAWYRQMTRYAIDAALVGVRPAKGLEDLEALIDERIKRALSEAVVVGDKLWEW